MDGDWGTGYAPLALCLRGGLSGVLAYDDCDWGPILCRMMPAVVVKKGEIHGGHYYKDNKFDNTLESEVAEVIPLRELSILAIFGSSCHRRWALVRCS